MPLLRPGLFRGLRTSSTTQNIQDVQSYLDYCKINDNSLESTSFRGTLYELATKSFLQKKLGCHSLVHAGGAYDNGVDLYGKWDLLPYWDRAKASFGVDKTAIHPEKIFEKGSKPVLKLASEFYDYFQNAKMAKRTISLSLDISILVQCKNYDTKISALIIREMIGVYHYHVTKTSERRRSFMFLVSPYPLTHQGARQVDSAQIPIVHCMMSPLVHQPSEKDIYNEKRWEGGALESVYMNGKSRGLLQGLQIERQMALLKPAKCR